ncbi:Uncharacterised protein [Vibrio cholerae]|nr:Uncharacterised protein [Vibrio cholerae]
MGRKHYLLLGRESDVYHSLLSSWCSPWLNLKSF